MSAMCPPTVGQIRPKYASVRQDPDRPWPVLARFGPILVRRCQALANTGQVRPNTDKIWPRLAKSGPLAQNLANLGQDQPTFGSIGLCWSNLAEVGKPMASCRSSDLAPTATPGATVGEPFGNFRTAGFWEARRTTLGTGIYNYTTVPPNSTCVTHRSYCCSGCSGSYCCYCCCCCYSCYYCCCCCSLCCYCCCDCCY